ncbi:23S rRNA (uracil(1939)-C(5))-methyltransferase RlmD [Aminobacterium mobile]|uniref:23S rRNA (uracil(1939)-C(5))-methyltransferase RlmD n=1 Tax=Aminobacterium mobile TaxID=81467 RepID=UPI0033146342
MGTPILHKENQHIELEIDALSNDGNGIAREKNSSYVYFVPGALPGERVRVTVLQKKKTYGIADVEEILSPHPQRVEPKCRWYSLCGGCQLQHFSYNAQLEAKKDFVRDAFRRIAHMNIEDILSPCVPSPRQWGYRNKASFPVQGTKDGIETGFYRRRSHDLVPIDFCPLLEPALNEIYVYMREALPALGILPYNEKNHSGMLRHLVFRYGSFSKEAAICFVCRRRLSKKDNKNIRELWEKFQGENINVAGVLVNHNPHRGNAILGRHSTILSGRSWLREYLDSLEIRYEATAFLQVNSYQAKQLYQYGVHSLRSSSADHLLELYAGVGSMTLFFAPAAAQITAVEEWSSAVEAMKENAKINRFSNIKVCGGRAEEIISSLKGPFEAVILDPPRSGCAPEVISKILELSPAKILYVACNPATLARDISRLCGEGRYTLKSLQPFDMFPQTAHVECVALIEREKV